MRAVILRLLRVAIFALSAALAPAAMATAQGRIDPSTGCSVLNDPIQFGPYNVLSGSPRVANGLVELRCDAPVLTLATRVTLTAGQSGIAEDRTMTNGTATLHYNLYTDPGRTRIVGEGPGGGAPLTPLLRQTRQAPGFGGGAARRGVYRVFGEIPANQAVPAGDYTDVIYIQVEF